MKSIATTALALAALLCAACAGHPGPDKPSRLIIDELALDPTLIKATSSSGEAPRTEVIDSRETFEQAQEAFSKRQYEKAVERYALIIEHFQDSDYFLASLYNSGLALDFTGRHAEAAALYRKVADTFPGRSEATDALFRLAGSLARLERHAEVVSVIDEIGARTSLTVGDRIEASVRLGDARLALGELSAAEEAYREALTMNRRAPVEDALPDDAYFIAGAQYGIGRVYHHLFVAIKFKLPIERMEGDLRDKIQLFEQSQSLYIRTIRLAHPYWTTASRYQIAKMYEDFYADLLTSEIPELTDEEAELYFEELRKKLRPLMDRALQYYERTITLSERQGVDNQYTQMTQEALDRLKSYLTDPRLQIQEANKVRAGQKIEALGLPPDEERVRPVEEAPQRQPEAPTEDGGDSRAP